MITNLTRQEARERAQLLDVHTYSVALDISAAKDPRTTTFASSSTVTFTATTAGTTFIDFIAETVSAVTINGSQLDPAETFDGARVTFPVQPGQNTLTVIGQAVYSRTGEGMHRFFDPADGKCYIYTQFEPTDARRVFANFDQPDLKAIFTFTVTAPQDFTVLSNTAATRIEPGTATAPAASGMSVEAAQTSARANTHSTTGAAGETTTTHYFSPTKRQSSYITCVCAGHYVNAQDTYTRGELSIPLGVYTRASLQESMEAEDIFTITKQGLDFFHDNFEYPYPWGKYDQIFVPEYNLGAMENPGLVTFVDNYIYRDAVTRTEYEARASVILHEMAHMWFGDLVTMTWWDDLWLKESFADYMAALALSEATEYSDGWTNFALRRKDWAYRQDQYATTHPVVADIPDVEAARQNFDGITYAKGASVLKQLVAFVGRDVFMAGSREYFVTHAFSNTSLEDFLLSLEAAAHGRDVRGWAKKWLQTTGVSELNLEVHTEASTTSPAPNRGSALRPVITHAAITQVNTATARIGEFGTQADATGVVRPHTLKVAGFNRVGANMEQVGVWDIDFATAHAEVPALVGVPHPDLLLLGHGDDDFAKVRLDEQSLATALRRVSKLTDSLDRAIVWSALTNATRDSLLAPIDFAHAYAKTLGRETHAGISAGLRDSLLGAVDRWMGATDQAQAVELVLGVALDTLAHTTAGSDEQLDLAELIIALVRRTAGIPAFNGLAWTNQTGAPPQAEEFPAVTAATDWVTGLLTTATGKVYEAGSTGLRIDNALRWKALIALVGLGLADRSNIEAEAAFDTSSSGALHAMTARAAQPLAVTKRRAFETAIRNKNLSNSALTATMNGFVSPTALPLLEPYVDRYFDELGRFWETRTNEIGKRLIVGLYPWWSNRGEHVATRTLEWLQDNPQAPRAVRRLLVELLEEHQRALRLQGPIREKGTRHVSF